MDDLWQDATKAYLDTLYLVEDGKLAGVTPEDYSFRPTPNNHLGAHYAYCTALHGPLRGTAVWVWESLVGGRCCLEPLCCFCTDQWLRHQWSNGRFG